jgi:hypothetical protein
MPDVEIAETQETIVEFVEATPPDPQAAWECHVWDEHQGKCSNCGSSDRLKARMVVPQEAGGQLVPSNGVLLCRTCEIAADSSRETPGDTRRPINFWVSRPLFDYLQDTAPKSSFGSMASLVRYLMTKYVEDEGRFDDLDNYQDAPGSDVKINVWIERDMYETFKDKVRNRGSSVTASLASLIKLYEAEGVALGKRKELE